MDTFEKPWTWRKGLGCLHPRSDPENKFFHAHDVNDMAACEPYLGITQSSEEVNEGSPLCVDCLLVVKANPSGRPKR